MEKAVALFGDPYSTMSVPGFGDRTINLCSSDFLCTNGKVTRTKGGSHLSYVTDGSISMAMDYIKSKIG